LTLTIEPSLDLANELLDTIMRNGGSLKPIQNYYNDGAANSAVVFGLENSENIEKELMENAMADAAANAQKMAGLVGKKIGKPIMASALTQWSGHPTQRKFKSKYISADPEKINVEVSISVTFPLTE